DLAAAASMIARCAGGDKTLALVEVLFEQQSKRAMVQQQLAVRAAIVKQAGMSQQAFDQCLSNQKLFNDIGATRTRANKEFGVSSDRNSVVKGKTVNLEGTGEFKDRDEEIEPRLKS